MAALIFLAAGLPGIVSHSSPGAPAAERTIAILSVPDIHSAVLPHATKSGSLAGGLAASAAVIRTLRADYDGSLLLSSGDDLGNDESGMLFRIFHGIPERTAMSAMGFDAGTIGNHDFDEGVAVYKESLGATTFPIVSANIRFDDPDLQERVRPFIIREVAGTRIGIFGLSYPDEEEYAPVLEGITLDPDTDAVAARMVRELKEEKVDIIIALTHLGTEKDHALARAVDGIDLIVGGHDHITYIDQVSRSGGRKTMMFDAGVYGENVSVFSFRFRGSGIEEPEWTVIPVDGSSGSDGKISSIIAPYEDEFREWAGTPAGSLDQQIRAGTMDYLTGQTDAGALVTTAMLHYRNGTDIAFCPAGSLNKSSLHPIGPITNGELDLMIDHNNRLSWICMPGHEILKVLETSAAFQKPAPAGSSLPVPSPHPLLLQTSGITSRIDLSREPGSRVSEVQLITSAGPVPLDPDGNYTVVVNTRIGQFSQGYQVFQNQSAGRVIDTDVRILDTVIAYVAGTTPAGNRSLAAWGTGCG